MGRRAPWPSGGVGTPLAPGGERARSVAQPPPRAGEAGIERAARRAVWGKVGGDSQCLHTGRTRKSGEGAFGLTLRPLSRAASGGFEPEEKRSHGPALATKGVHYRILAPGRENGSTVKGPHEVTVGPLTVGTRRPSARARIAPRWEVDALHPARQIARARESQSTRRSAQFSLWISRLAKNRRTCACRTVAPRVVSDRSRLSGNSCSSPCNLSRSTSSPSAPPSLLAVENGFDGSASGGPHMPEGLCHPVIPAASVPSARSPGLRTELPPCLC